jgi:hypothetical protein
MWLLLIIILSNAPVSIVESKVIGIYYSPKECNEQMEEVFESNLPMNVNVGCVQLKGVRQANG